MHDPYNCESVQDCNPKYELEHHGLNLAQLSTPTYVVLHGSHLSVEMERPRDLEQLVEVR